MPGAGLAHGPPATKKAGGSDHRFSRTSGIPCAMALRLIRDLPGDRLFCPRLRQRACAPCAGLSTGRPGPHDFTSVMRRSSARASASCDAPRPPHPRPTCRDDRAQRPSQRGGMARDNHDFRKLAIHLFFSEVLDILTNQHIGVSGIGHYNSQAKLLS